MAAGEDVADDTGDDVREEYISMCEEEDEQTETEENYGSRVDERSQITKTGSERAVVVKTASRPLSTVTSITPLRKNFDFHARTNFDATQNILQSRSDSYILRPPPSDLDIWKRKPPDFRPQSFAPRPPPRNSKYAVQPWIYRTPKDEYYEESLRKRKEEVLLPDIAKPNMTQSLDRPEFIRRFHITDPDEARQTFVREGKFPDGPYVQPRPHDFRGYPPIKKLGLDEFITSYERDPFNIKFHTLHPRTITGHTLGVTERDIIPGPAFAPPLHQPPKWEATLHLPQGKFPTRPRDYTRYRRRDRDVHSAFMDRVEETLTAKWSREQMERALNGQPREGKVKC